MPLLDIIEVNCKIITLIIFMMEKQNVFTLQKYTVCNCVC